MMQAKLVFVALLLRTVCRQMPYHWLWHQYIISGVLSKAIIIAGIEAGVGMRAPSRPLH